MIKNRLTPEILEKLLHIAKIESIGASTRLVGSKLSNKEIKTLLLRLKADSFNNQDNKTE